MRPRRRILVVGGESRVGAALAAAHAARGDVVTTTTRRQPAAPGEFLDLATVPGRWTPPPGTDLAYLCAGITSIRDCEEQPAHTAHRNVHGTLQLCRALAEAGALVVFFSTNLVFDGETPFATVETPICPRCAYGRQKAEVEAALRNEDIPAAIIRVSKVVHPSHALFSRWTESLQRGDPIASFTDMTLAPITLESLVGASVVLAEHRFRGHAHLSAAGDISYFEAARHLARRLGAPAALVHRHTARETLARDHFIPRHTTLAVAPAAPIAFIPPDPRLAIDAFLAGAATAATPA